MKEPKLRNHVIACVLWLIICFMVWLQMPDQTKEDEMVIEPRIEMVYGTIPESTKRPYFAYGTLTSAEVMLRMAKDAEFVGVAAVYGYTRDGLLRIEEEAGAVVCGALWLISARDEARLDEYEGVAGGLYEKIEVDGVLIYY